ncbi:phiSA1p31-related protein [Streptomyces sp. NPDC058620]|uniref:phiSA1p31-related protein n=1 Tax=Streptomyces sp. NPDC058620 TaxID=3346560 RepID=UPI00365B2209
MTTAPQTTWELDGVEFDLTRTWIDVYGARWDWTGGWEPVVQHDGTSADEPLMQREQDIPMVLSLVYSTYGPLIPAPRPATSAELRSAITACHGPAELAQLAPTPGTFAVILQRLRGRSA